MKPILTAIIVALTGLGVCVSNGAVLTTFSFTGALGNEVSFAADSQPTGASVSSMTRGPGVNNNDTAADAFTGTAWTTSSVLDENDYYTFTITPEANFLVTLTRLELDERRSGTGIGAWAVYSSLDSYGAALGTFTVPDDTNTRVNQGVDLPGGFVDLPSAVTFRIYGYLAEGAAGTWRIDNVELLGDVTPVPEPAEWGLICVVGLLGVCGLHTWRERRRAWRSSPGAS